MAVGESELIEKGRPCEDCGSSDARALYSDGHEYCFACPKEVAYKKPKKGAQVLTLDSPEMEERRAKAKVKSAHLLRELQETSDHTALPKWKITQKVARAADYRTRIHAGRAQHIALYHNLQGQVVFAKVRDTGEDGTKKDFWAVGDKEQVSLYGIETLSGRGGKMVVVTEGEKDRLAGLQLWDAQFPVVAVPFGAESSGNAFAEALPILSKYEKVILALDMDEQGRHGAEFLAAMLPPGKAFIPDFPEKDLHETFFKQGLDVAKNAIWNARPFTPDGIVDADDLDAQLMEPQSWGASLPYDFLYDWTYGLQGGDVWVLGAGTGVGKSDLGAEIGAHHIKPKEDGGNYQRAAVFDYESGSLSSLKRILGKLWSKRFNIPDPRDGSPNVYWSQQDLLAARAYRREKCAKLFINDHKGAISWESVKERLRYLKHSQGITLGIVDPVAAMVAGEVDERKALDLLFAEAKSLAEELDITLIFISHLARPKEGKSHEEGGRVTLSQFRGSGAIVMWASFVVVLERNQQGDEDERKLTTLRMLKDRKTGDSTGRTAGLVYNVLTGRLEEWEGELDKLSHSQVEEDATPEPPPMQEE